MWSLVAGLVHKYEVTQGVMIRAMLRVFLKDKSRNEIIRERTKVDEHVLEWRQKDSVGHPLTHWTDDLCKVTGGGWMRIAENRDIWRELGEAVDYDRPRRSEQSKLSCPSCISFCCHKNILINIF
ncbi:unnamed protein product [Euphydryas editha]|uniref:Uncharacterized protein n=1 Tax=Euphydryas editha TaxID=104508 RepID=A0AAU9TZ55_EUPED|nr:unnamed protein product [Euphydryas editha]